MNTETFTRCYKFALSRSPDYPPPIPWPGWVPFSSLPMIWEGKLIAGGADMQAGPANLPQRDPHLSATPNLKNPTSPQLTSAGCRPRSSRLILLSIVPCVGRRKKGPNWKKWWASEFGRGTLGSELQGQGGCQPTGRWWRGSPPHTPPPPPPPLDSNPGGRLLHQSGPRRQVWIAPRP